MRDTKDILVAWANSRVERRVGTEYPLKSAGIEGAERSFDFRHYLTEDEASIVDGAVLLLKKDDEFSYGILKGVYLDNISINRQAKVLNKRYEDVNKLLHGAEKFVRARIFDKFH